MILLRRKQRTPGILHTWLQFSQSQRKIKMSSQDILQSVSTLASYNVLLQVNKHGSWCVLSIYSIFFMYLFIYLSGFMSSGNVPCAHLSSECLYAAVCVQRADWGGQCQVKFAGKQHNGFRAPAAVTCVLTCVFIMQAYTAVFHISVSVQRGFPEGLSERAIGQKPQLETSYQSPMDDVSWLDDKIGILIFSFWCSHVISNFSGYPLVCYGQYFCHMCGFGS